MNVYELLPDYMAKLYGNKTVALTFTTYDGGFEVKEFTNNLDLALFVLKRQAEIWENGKCVVSVSNSCDFARDVFRFFDSRGQKEICHKIVRNKLKNNLPLDLIRKYA